MCVYICVCVQVYVYVNIYAHKDICTLPLCAVYVFCFLLKDRHAI